MMTKYILFAGKVDIVELEAYVNCLIDQEILGEPIEQGSIWKQEEATDLWSEEKGIELWFPGDEDVKQILRSLSPDLPSKYVAFRAEVIDEAKADVAASKIQERYGLEHRIYDA